MPDDEVDPPPEPADPPRPWYRRRNEFWIAIAGVAAVITAGVSVLTEWRDDDPAIRLSCLVDGEPKPGGTVRLTFRISSDRDADVGIGAGFYNIDFDEPLDIYGGAGNIDSKSVSKGDNSVSRFFYVPTTPPGRYEIVAEVWPANKIGHDGVNTYADVPCGDGAAVTIP